MLVAIFNINKGTHYKVCDNFTHAAQEVKRNFQNFICVLPDLHVPDNATSEEFIALAKRGMKGRKCIKKRAFLNLLKKNK